MRLSLKNARILLSLLEGKSIPSSAAKAKLIDNLVSENILFRKGKHRKTLQLLDKDGLLIYLQNQLQINDLNHYITALENEDSTRAELVRITTDSKNSKERAFKGFLVNTYQKIEAEMNSENFTINPSIGSFTFIYDYESFKIPKEITIVGVENAKNFRCIEEQKYLFKDLKPLFVSRYPQSQHKDFIKWMRSIPNNYLHFGDFDISGIGIYLNEYKIYLSEKASFFIPDGVEKDIINSGNRERYNTQKQNFKIEDIQDSEIIDLLKIIKSEKKGLDQEFYIKSD